MTSICPRYSESDSRAWREGIMAAGFSLAQQGVGDPLTRLRLRSRRGDVVDGRHLLWIIVP